MSGDVCPGSCCIRADPTESVFIYIWTKNQTLHPAQTLYIRLQGTLDHLKRSPVQETGNARDLSMTYPLKKMQGAATQRRILC